MVIPDGYDPSFFGGEPNVLASRRWNHNKFYVNFSIDFSIIPLWCQQRDLNPQTLRCRLLRPVCMPFHHVGSTLLYYLFLLVLYPDSPLTIYFKNLLKVKFILPFITDGSLRTECFQ